MDNDDESIPGITKHETKIINDIIGELTEDSSRFTSGDQFFAIFTNYQVAPERQLKVILQLAHQLIKIAESTDERLEQDQYLRLSTLVNDSIQEKFQGQESGGAPRRGRAAKTNATINMESYYNDVEPTLFNTSDDEKSKKRRKKEAEKVVWSDSELQETAPVPKPPKVVETVDSTDEEMSPPRSPSPPTKSAKSRSPQKRHLRRRKRVYDVVTIDSSSEDDPVPPPQKPPQKSTIKPGTPDKRDKSPDIRPSPKAAKQGKTTIKIGKPPRKSKSKLPPVTEAGLAKVLTAADKLSSKGGEKSAAKTGEKSAAKTGEKSAVKTGEKSAAKTGEKSAVKTGEKSAAKTGEKSAAKTGEKSAAKTGEKSAAKTGEKSAVKTGEKSAAKGGAKASSVPKPVGVVKATPRPTPLDSRRSVANCINEDEALILNFKKGHYPTFQNKYTHLAVAKKPHGEMFTDTSPKVAEVLALDTTVHPASELANYSLKQFIHNDSGQYMVGEQEGELYLIVPGIVNKDNASKEKT